MLDSFNPGTPETVQPSIFLDYGVDGVAGEDAACELCERGMRFHSCWRFEPGTVMSIAFSYNDNGTPRRIEVEGAVVDCAPEEAGRQTTTLVFLGVPENFRETLRKVGPKMIATSPRLPRPPCP